jgi:hypothetical protein
MMRGEISTSEGSVLVLKLGDMLGGCGAAFG